LAKVAQVALQEQELVQTDNKVVLVIL